MLSHTKFRSVAAVGLGLLLIAASGPSGAEAQGVVWPPDWTVGATFESYSFADAEATGVESVTLITVPITAETEVADRLIVQLASAFARGSLSRPDGESSSVAGLTDTALRIALPLNELATIGFTLRAPTGTATYSQEELAVAGVIAADLLPFRISSWGTGGGVGLDVSGATLAGDYGVRYSAGYQQAGSFEPLEGAEFTYRPGNELRARVVVDRTLSGGRKAALQVGMMRYGEDEVEDQNLYRAGDRYQVIGSYSVPMGRMGSAVAYGGVLHRSQGTALVPDGATTTPLADGPSQNLLLAGAGMRTTLGSVLMLPSADVRLLRSSDGVGQGVIASLGTSLELPIGQTDFIDQGMVLVPTVRLRYGRVLVVEDVSSTVMGIDIGATARFGRD